MKRKIAMMLLAFAIFLPCVFALTACGGNEQDNAKVTSVSVEFNSVDYELIDNTITIPYGQKLEFDNTDFTIVAHLDDGKDKEVSFKDAKDSGYTYTSTLPTDCDITPRGEYTVTFSYLEFEIVVNVNVVKATIDMSNVEWDYVSAFTYDGEVKQVSVINLPEGVTVNYSGNSATDTGDYTAIAVFTYIDTENYNLIANMELPWEIAPAAYVVSESDISIDSYDFTYDATEKQVALNTSKLDSNVEIDEISGNVAKNAGTHTITITFNYVGQSANYNRVVPMELTWKIKQANLIVTANNATIAYGDEGENDGVEYSGFVASEDESVLTGTLSYQYVDYEVGSSVGTYAIIPTGLSSNNYNIQFAEGLLTVEKAELVIKANDHSITYNQPASHNGVTSTGLKAGDVLTDLNGEIEYSYNYNVGDNVGDYVITISGLSSDNYNISYQTGKLIVGKSDIDTFGINLTQKQFTYNGSAITVEVDESTLPQNVSVVSIDNNVETNAGEYTACIILEHTDTTNYNRTTLYCDWYIEKADADLSAVSLKSNKFDYNGKIQGIELVNIPSYAKISTIKNNQAKNADNYEVEVVFVNEDTDNYNAFEITKTFSWVINAVKLTVSAKNNTIIYLDEAQDAGVEYAGFVNGEDDSVLAGTLMFDFGEYQVGSDVYHTYTITPSGLTATNYDIEFVAGTLTVTPKEIDLSGVEWDIQSQYTYTGEVIRPTLVNVPENVELRYYYGISTDDGIKEIAPLNAGTYEVLAKLYAVSGNFKLVNGAVERGWTYIINPIEVDLTDVDWVGGNEFTYNGEAVKPVLNIETLPYTTISYHYFLSSAEQVGGTYPGVENPTDAGYYTASVTLQLPDETNYIFTNRSFLTTRQYRIIKADIDAKQFTWKETLTKSGNADIIREVITIDTHVIFEQGEWSAWGITTLENTGYMHVLEIGYNIEIQGLEITYSGDNNATETSDDGYYLYATITLSEHKNYNDFSMNWMLGYNIVDNVFTSMAVNGKSVEFEEFVNLEYLQVGNVLTFKLKKDYVIPEQNNYVTYDNGVYTMEIKYSTVDKYFIDVCTKEYFGDSTTEFYYETRLCIYINPYILKEVIVDGKTYDTSGFDWSSIELGYGQDSIAIDFDRDDFEKFDLYYTIQKMDDNYETVSITSLPFNVPNATNIKNFSIYCRNKGQDELVQSFDVLQFAPFDDYIITKETLNGGEDVEYLGTYNYLAYVHNAIITGLDVDWKEGCEDWAYEIFADEDLQNEVNWFDLDSLDKIYIVVYTPNGEVFGIHELNIRYEFYSNYRDDNYSGLSLVINDEEVQQIFNDGDGKISIGFDNHNSDLEVSCTIGGETELTLTQDITNAVVRLEIEHDGNVYFVEKTFTFLNCAPYQSMVGVIEFVDDENNHFGVHNNTLYISDIEELQENLENLEIDASSCYEVVSTEIITFEGETYLKVGVNYKDANQGNGSNEDDEESTDSGNDGDNSGLEDNNSSGNEGGYDNSGNGTIIDGGFGNVVFPSGYAAGDGSQVVYFYIRVCVNEEFNTNTNAIVRVWNNETENEQWIMSNKYPIIINDRNVAVMYVDLENYYAKVVVTDEKGNTITSDEMNRYVFSMDGIYTLSIRALKGDAVIYKIYVGDVSIGGGESGGDDNQDPDEPEETVELFRVTVGEQTLVQVQKGYTEPSGDFDFVNGDIAQFSATLNQSAWNQVVDGYLKGVSLVSPYLQFNPTVTDGEGNVITNFASFDLRIQKSSSGNAYVYFKVLLTAGEQVEGAEFYLYLPEQNGGDDNQDPDEPEETVELFKVVAGNQTFTQIQMPNSAPTGDFEFIVDEGGNVIFVAYLNESAFTCIDEKGYFTVTSISSSYLGEGTTITLTDYAGNPIESSTNFKVRVFVESTEAIVMFNAAISDEMSAMIVLLLPIQSGDTEENEGGYYSDEFVYISIMGMYGAGFDFEVVDNVIDITNWNLSYDLECGSNGPNIYVMLLDSDGNELTGEFKVGIQYCFQYADTYTILVYNGQGEEIETFTINLSGDFSPLFSVTFDGTTLSESCDETLEPVGDFTYTMDMSNQERFMANFKGYIGSSAKDKIMMTMASGRTLKLDNIGGIWSDKLYYDTEGTKPITGLNNVVLEVKVDAYNNMYVMFCIIEHIDMGYVTMDVVMNVSLYLCSRDEYKASLDYPLTIEIGQNTLDFRAKPNDVGEYGDMDFDTYYSGVPYIELERNTLGLVDDATEVTLTWNKTFSDYSYCVFTMEAFAYLESGELDFDELIKQGYIYYCNDSENNTVKIPMQFMSGMSFLMVGMEGFTGEIISETDIMIMVFLIKGEATLEDFGDMMEGPDGPETSMPIPDIEITVGEQILSTMYGDFQVDYDYYELYAWLEYNHDDLVQYGETNAYINVDSIIISAECELFNGCGQSITFEDAQVAIFNYRYGASAEIRVDMTNGFSFRIFLIFADSIPDGSGESGNVSGKDDMTFTSLPDSIDLEIEVNGEVLTSKDFIISQSQPIIVAQLSSTRDELIQDNGTVIITSLETNLGDDVFDGYRENVDSTKDFEVASFNTYLGIGVVIIIENEYSSYQIILLFADSDDAMSNSSSSFGMK